MSLEFVLYRRGCFLVMVSALDQCTHCCCVCPHNSTYDGTLEVYSVMVLVQRTLFGTGLIAYDLRHCIRHITVTLRRVTMCLKCRIDIGSVRFRYGRAMSRGEAWADDMCGGRDGDRGDDQGEDRGEDRDDKTWYCRLWRAIGQGRRGIDRPQHSALA